MNTHRKKLFLLSALVVSFYILPTTSFAGSKPIGTECSGGAFGNSECVTDQCENADNGKAYCVCGELDLIPLPSPSKSCLDRYGQAGQSANDWLCSDGADATHDLNYCINSKLSKGFFALTPTDVSLVDLFLDTTAAVQILGDELKQMIAKPQTRIAIPGLSFTDVDKLTQTTDETGATYMYFPFLGEYLATIYKYAIAVMGIIAVIMIIVGGVVWITSGGIPERVNQAKTIIVRSVVGMILAVGSYTLLYTINPELVQFRNLKVLTIQPDPLPEIFENDSLYESDSSSAQTSPGSPVRVCDSNESCMPICNDKDSWKNATSPGIATVAETVSVLSLNIPGITASSKSVKVVSTIQEGLQKAGQEAVKRGFVIKIESGHRTLQRQLELACPKILNGTMNSKFVAWPGGSNHGSGKAIDVRLLKGNTPISGPLASGQQNDIQWQVGNKALAEVMYAAGWKRLKSEVWHFEYPGTPVERTRTTSCFETSC